MARLSRILIPIARGAGSAALSAAVPVAAGDAGARADKRADWRSLAAIKGSRALCQWLDTLPERTNSRTAHLNKHKELAHVSPETAQGDSWRGRHFLAGAVACCVLPSPLTRFHSLFS